MTAEYHLISEDPSQVSRAGFDDCAPQADGLARTIAEIVDCDHGDAKELVALASQRLPIADRRLGLLARSVVRLARRVREVETHSRELASQVDSHEQSLRMICEILKQLDDPYGFGLSLDDRIADEDSDVSSSERD